jgi:hypothetical protein
MAQATRLQKRWGIAAAGVVVQMALGAVYAWSLMLVSGVIPLLVT